MNRINECVDVLRKPPDTMRRSREGVVHDPLCPDAEGSGVIRAALQSGRRFRVTSEETGRDCTVEVLAAFLLAGAARPLGPLDGLLGAPPPRSGG